MERPTYLRVVRLSGAAAQNNRKKEAALHRAYELRSFEIKNFWTRATYFFTAQAGILAAIGFLIEDGKPRWEIALALSILGLWTAACSLWSAQGSKFWQSNWEKHIDLLEDDFEGRLHKHVWLTDGRVQFSVSRVQFAQTYGFLVFWAVLSLYTAIQTSLKCNSIHWIQLLLPVVVAMSCLLGWSSGMLRTNFKSAKLISDAGQDEKELNADTFAKVAQEGRTRLIRRE